MSALAVFSAWLTSGVVLAWLFAPRPDPWWRWMPIALVFGPLWLAIVAEQQNEPERV